jgi:DNA modification methylase
MSNITTFQLRPDAWLYQADCRDVLRALPPNCLDSCVTDPPYNIESITKRFGKNDAAVARHGKDGAYTRLSQKFIGVQWDGQIAFDPEFWAEVLRVLRPGAHVASFGFPKRWHRVAAAIEDAGFEIRDSVAWFYGTGQVRRRENLKPGHEPICIARKPLSEPTLAANLERWGVGALQIESVRGPDNRWPANVVQTDAFDKPWFYNAKANAADRAGSNHPSVKPVSLVKWIIELTTPKGGVILDPFAGSGTTMQAALQNGYRCVGIEREDEYVADIVRRIQQMR